MHSTAKPEQPRSLTASVKPTPTLLAHVEAKQAKQTERARLRYERTASKCHVSRVP